MIKNETIPEGEGASAAGGSYEYDCSARNQAIQNANDRITEAEKKLEELSELKGKLQTASDKAAEMLGEMEDLSGVIAESGKIAGKSIDGDNASGLCADCYMNLRGAYDEVIHQCTIDEHDWTEELKAARKALEDANKMECVRVYVGGGSTPEEK
jgi:chromosome segregation ATPase